MSSTRTIQTGYYTIRSAKTGTYIGRRAVEDHSLRPKPIVLNAQPQGFPESQTTTFLFKQVGRNRYSISCEGAATAAIHRELYAVLQPGQVEGDTIWTVEYDERGGRNRFAIFNHFGNWRTPYAHEGGDQVKVSLVPLPAALPPLFRDEIVWIIDPVDGPDN